MSACVDPTPPQIIDLRSTERKNYVELTSTNKIHTWGDFIDSLCSQSGQNDPTIYSNNRNLFFRVSLSTDTLVEAESNDDYLALSPYMYCGRGHPVKMLAFFQVDNEVRFNGGVIRNSEDYKKKLKGFYRLDTGLSFNYPLPEKVHPTMFRIQLYHNDKLRDGLRLINRIVLSYLELSEEYPNDIPSFQIFLDKMYPPPPPPPPPSPKPSF